MATSAKPPPGALPVEGYRDSDPFISPPAHDGQRHRYSSFDTQLFSIYSSGSPSQTRRALEAHLAETERRLQEASQLGTVLVQQRKDLAERLKEVEKQQEESEIGPELRQRLVELEREFNEVGRETARAFIPRSRVPSGEAADAAANAAVFSSEAQSSPSKVTVPSRKQRNQPSSRIHDIKLATEISSSLLTQLRDLQGVLVEKDDALKALDRMKSHLELEVQGLAQRLRSLGESEQRYKDENWSLETQLRDLIASAKESADREQRLSQALNASRAGKAAIVREFEELKQTHAKLNDDHEGSRKHHDSELSTLRRSISAAEAERSVLQRKVEDLAAQNQELAKAVTSRFRAEEQAGARDTATEDEEDGADVTTPENSPPPSPSKATPRHGQLESETLRSSLHHAHRMIQNLKNNIHREKTEKIELRRMLQEARDEIDIRKTDAGSNGVGSAGRRRKGAQQDVFKKPARPDRLGAPRRSREEIILDEPEWEDHEDPITPSKPPSSGHSRFAVDHAADPAGARSPDVEAVGTTDDTEAFETAHEQEEGTTETDAFHTGIETLGGEDSDDLTETEDLAPMPNPQRPSPNPLMRPGRTNSYQSTASTSADEYDDLAFRTPVQFQHPRYRLRINRGGHRRSTRSSVDTFTGHDLSTKDSPASVFSNGSQPGAGQSLFAELGNLSGEESEEDSHADGTPSRSFVSPSVSPEFQLRRPVLSRSHPDRDAEPKPEMTDSGMMTEPWEPPVVPLPTLVDAATSPVAPRLDYSAVTSQASQPVEPVIEPVTLSLSTASSLSTEPVEPRVDVPALDISTLSAQQTEPLEPRQPPFSLSAIDSQETESLSPIAELPPALMLAPVSVQQTEPLEPVKTSPPSIPLNISSLVAQQTQPVEASPPAIPLNVSPLVTQQTEPAEMSSPSIRLNISALATQQTEPVLPEPQSKRSSILGMLPGAYLGLGLPTLPQRALSAPSVLPIHAAPLGAPPGHSKSLSSASASPPTELDGLGSTANVDSGAGPHEAPRLELAAINAQDTEPQSPVLPSLGYSSVSSQSTQPKSVPLHLGFSSVTQQAFEPVPSQTPALSVSISPSQSTEPVAPSAAKSQVWSLSSLCALETEPETPIDAAEIPRRQPLALSDIVALQTEPVQPRLGATALDVGLAPTMLPGSGGLPPSSSEAAKPGTASLNPPGRGKALAGQVTVAEDGRSNAANGQPDEIDRVIDEVQSGQHLANGVKNGRIPFMPIDGNSTQRGRNISRDESLQVKPLRLKTADEGTQTVISSDEIDKLLRAKHRISQDRPPSSPRKLHHPMGSPDGFPYKTTRRPGSAGSVRSRTTSPPPLPADHKEVIAAAAQRAPPPPPSPGQMAPPSAPASAYKAGQAKVRQRTPSIDPPASPNSRSDSTPRPRFSHLRSDTPITRRSSVSSFASECDQRFGIQRNANGEYEPPTDPRMIQAITQTMIGEFLWKYTRKAGRGDMSENRHRRFFWVHPYTRTLYWSEQDPATAGKNQLKAKSVAIEAVRVVTDDNPLPPGLHRKSIIVITPGRNIKFTATTGQRHETWFNALSYLLLRTSAEREEGENSLTPEDVDEFNPRIGRSASRTARSRASLSSYNSRTTRTSSPQLASHVPNLTVRQSQATIRQQQASHQHSMSGRFSSLSGMFRPSATMRGSFSSRRSRQSIQQEASIYDASVVHDSAEDLRQVIEQQEREADRLENVRACCDGKHDVGTLTRKGRHGGHAARHSSTMHSGTTHTRNGSLGPNSHYHHQNEMEAANLSC